jgi:hypothetical protein
MSFDGAVSKEGAGVGVWISPPKVGTKLCSYKLSFDCTNNMLEGLERIGRKEDSSAWGIRDGYKPSERHI